MKVYSLIGAVVLISLPFAIFSLSVNNNTILEGSNSLVYRTSDAIIFGESSESIQLNWLSADGVYGDIFGDLWFLGALVLIGAIAAIPLSIVEGKKKSTSTILVLGMSVLLFLVRWNELSQDDLSFYKKSSFFGQQSVYYEIPLSPILGIVLSLVQFTKGKN